LIAVTIEQNQISIAADFYDSRNLLPVGRRLAT